MASTRPGRKTWCTRCGASLTVIPGRRTVKCPLCRSEKRIDHRHGLHQQAVGFLRSLLHNMSGSISSHMSSPPPSLSPSPSARPGQPAGQQLPASYPEVHGKKKRALLVGISYKGTKYELKGTVNDVNCMSYLLRQKFGFPEDCILVLTDDDKDPYRIPTRNNLLMAMRWLVKDCSQGDSLVFHFSGHGVQKLDNNGDDIDGYDEALCPFDWEVNGLILDDEVNQTIVRPLGPGVKLHAIVDACHSGTILDLPYLCRISRTGYWQWDTHVLPSSEPKSTSGGLAILISGCNDNQTSADSNAISDANSTGAMTYSFIHALESEPGTTYGRLLTAMRAVIRDNGGSILLPGPLGLLIRRITFSGGTQEPQLSASEKFDIYRKPFLL